MTVPALPQHLSALERAQFIRLHRGALRREIRSYDGPDSQDVGREKVAAVLELSAEDREVFATMKVAEMIGWVRHLTNAVAARYAAAVGASEFKTVEQLTDRQRLRLVELLRGGIDALKEAEQDNEVARWVAKRTDDRSAA